MSKVIIRKPTLSLVGVPREVGIYIKPLSDSINLITGAAGNRQITKLKSSANNQEIIEKINEIIAQINVSGEARDGYS
jgi:hypothetical protein